MVDLSKRPAVLVGVDFSGAADAGHHIWVTRAEPRGEQLHVRACLRADTLPGGGRRREVALPALVAWLAAQGRPEAPCVAGLDFPFGLHRSLAEALDLRAFILAFPGRWPSPEAMQAACKAAGRERDQKRRCDVEQKTPFAPHNLRLYLQTWHGIAQVLAPLLAGGARIAPNEGAPGASGGTGLWLLETCPASTLKAAELYLPYKGRTAAHREARRRLLRDLDERGVVVPPEVAQAALEDRDGDALDSLYCAEVAWRAARAAARGEASHPPLSDAHRLEGYVYA